MGILASIPKEIKEIPLDGNALMNAYGVLAEEILVQWARKNSKEALKCLNLTEPVRLSGGRPNRRGRVKIRGKWYKNVLSDYFFIVSTPSNGKMVVLFEAKFGRAPIGSTQAQYFARVQHYPERFVRRAKSGHVILAKCLNLDLDERKMIFYIGEVPEIEERLGGGG